MVDEGAPPQSKPDLPPIAAHATDLEAIKRSVEDAAAVSGGLWLSYLLALFYLAVAAGAVSHADLFLENPVKLPFLNIELQLKAFFLIAPLLFVVIHVYTLTYFVILSNKARWYHYELRQQDRRGGRSEAAGELEGTRHPRAAAAPAPRQHLRPIPRGSDGDPAQRLRRAAPGRRVDDPRDHADPSAAPAAGTVPALPTAA